MEIKCKWGYGRRQLEEIKTQYPGLDVDLIIAAPDLRDAAVEAEQALGENLQWLRDRFDLEIRQGEDDVIGRLVALDEAWKGLAKAKVLAEHRRKSPLEREGEE